MKHFVRKSVAVAALAPAAPVVTGAVSSAAEAGCLRNYHWVDVTLSQSDPFNTSAGCTGVHMGRSTYDSVLVKGWWKDDNGNWQPSSISAKWADPVAGASEVLIGTHIAGRTVKGKIVPGYGDWDIVRFRY